MNPRNKSSLIQALGLGLASAAAATLARGAGKRSGPSFSPLGFLSGRRRSHNPFRRGLAGALSSTPILSNFIGGRSVKRDLLSSALLGLSAGLGSLAAPQHRRSALGGALGSILGRRGGGFWGARGAHGGSGLATVGRLLAGGLVAAAASKLLNKTLRDRVTHEPHNYERTSRERSENEPHTHETRVHGRQTHDQPGF
jgi:hypothetical protein